MLFASVVFTDAYGDKNNFEKSVWSEGKPYKLLP